MNFASLDNSLNKKTTLQRIVSLDYQTRPRTSFKNLAKATEPLMIRNPPIHSVAERNPSTPPMINRIDKRGQPRKIKGESI